MKLVSSGLNLPKNMNTSPVFFHTDILGAIQLVNRRQDLNDLMDEFLLLCRQIADFRDIWMPVFSYRYTQVGIYDVQNDPSDIGALSEYYRKKSDWRTIEPVFSVAGFNGTNHPLIQDPTKFPKFYAFGPDSIFSKLVEYDGIIVWLGASLKNSITLVHYAEYLFDVPYRYNKVFGGKIIDNDNEYNIELEYFVKPKEFKLSFDYDIRLAAISKGVINILPGSGGSCYYCYASDLLGYFSDFLSKNQLALLDERSRHWVNSRLDKLGHRFFQSDFE